MSPQDIEAVYNDLSQVPQQTADQAIGEIGASQAAQGPSAAAMGASGGSGIGNYTYNRLVDPAVQQLRTQLVATGRSEALNRAINLALQQAQERYRNAANTYANSASSGGGSSSGSGGNGTITGVDETVTAERTPNDVTGLGPIYATDGAKGAWDVGNDWIGIDTTTGGTVTPNIFGENTGDNSSGKSGGGSSLRADWMDKTGSDRANAIKDSIVNQYRNGDVPMIFM